MKSFLENILTATAPASREVTTKMELRDLQRRSPPKVSHFVTSENLNLGDLAAEQARLVLRAFLVGQKYAITDNRIGEFFVHVFCIKRFPVTPLNGVWYLQLVSSRGRAEAQVPFSTSLLTSLKTQLNSHASDLMSSVVARKRLNMLQNAVVSTLASMEVQLIQNAWDGITKSCFPGPLRDVTHLYLSFSCVVVRFQTLS